MSSLASESVPLKGGAAKRIEASSDIESAARLRRYQIFVYVLTFTAYAMSHFSRKAYTFFKKNMRDDDGMPIVLQGRLDSIFMFSYAIGSFFSGNLGDRYHPPWVISLGLLGAGLCVALFVFGLWSHLVISSYILASIYFMLVWLVHGLFQSTGGPVNTVVMGNWFPAKNRGLIFGTWTCHQYTGNIIGALVSSAILYSGVHYYWALFIPVAANIVWAIVIYYLLPARPAEVGLDFDQDNNSTTTTTTASHVDLPTSTNLPPPITILNAFRIPAVSMYAMAFGFFKLTNYTLFFWLPFFFTKYFTPAQANLISMLYDVGMMPGGIIVGWVSDLFGGRRATVCAVLLVLLCPLLFVFGLYADVMPVTLLLFLMGFMGILVGGPNNIITSAVAADLALHPSIRGNNRALGTVTGIINGSGSITAALGLLVVTWLQDTLGWMYVWNFLIACTVAGVLLMMPKIVAEVKGNDGYEPL